MVPAEFLIGGPVYVKGHRVEMSVKAINEYYGLETDVNHVGGLTPNPNLTPYNEDFNELCCYSLIPRSKQTMVTPEMADVLYSILNNLPINISYIIRQQIIAIGFSGTLITTWLPTDISLNCWGMTLIIDVELNLR
ncbi:hypothetical protein ACOSQ4_027296 [Xanthoceras sorbifolium]